MLWTRQASNQSDVLRSSAHQLAGTMSESTSEMRKQFFYPLLQLCNSKTIYRCPVCVEAIQETTNLLVRCLSSGNHYLLQMSNDFKEVLKVVMQYCRRHQRLISRLGLRPFRHDSSVVQKLIDRLREAVSLLPTTTRPLSSNPPATTPETASPEWPKFIRIFCYGLEAILAGIPPVSSLSIIPKAGAAAMATLEKCHQNSEVREEIGQWLSDIEAAGPFTHLDRPIQLFEQLAYTMDTRPQFKRLVYAASEEQSLNDAEKKIDRALMLEMLVQTSKALQHIQELDTTVLLLACMAQS